MLSKIYSILNKILARQEIVFIMVASVIGLICVFTIPPLAANDEISHVARIYEISDGRFLTSKMQSTENFGGKVPNQLFGLYTANRPFDQYTFQKGTVTHAREEANRTSINDTRFMTEISYSGAALYSPISYAPHVIAMKVAKFLDLSILSTTYLIRLTSLSTFLILAFCAIRLIPTKKWFLLTVALLPMSILLASNISIDGVVIGSVLLFIAIVTRIYYTKRQYINYKNYTINLLWPLMFTAIYLALAKPVYAPLLLLSIPTLNKLFVFKSKEWIKWVCITIAIPLAFMFTWNTLITVIDVHSGQRLSVNSVGIYPATSTEFLSSFIKNPTFFAKVLIHTFFENFGGKQEIPNYILSSFSGKFTEYRITPAIWMTSSVLLSLILSFSFKERTRVLFSKWTKIFTSFSLLAIAIAISLSMYLYATTAGQDTINGIQGRYFIPLLPFLIILACKTPLLEYRSSTFSKLIILSLTLTNILVMLYLLFKVF